MVAVFLLGILSCVFLQYTIGNTSIWMQQRAWRQYREGRLNGFDQAIGIMDRLVDDSGRIERVLIDGMDPGVPGGNRTIDLEKARSSGVALVIARTRLYARRREIETGEKDDPVPD